jgi:hypothetical protein
MATSWRVAANTAGISDAEIGEQFDDLTTFLLAQEIACAVTHITAFFETIVVQMNVRLQPLSVWGRAISNRSARGRSYFSAVGGPTSI